MEDSKVRLSEVDCCHVERIELLSDGLGRFSTENFPGHLLSHETVHVPVIVGQLARVLKVAQNFLAECAKLASKGNLRSVDQAQVNLSWLVQDHFRLDVLVRWLVPWVKWALMTHVAVLDAS